MKISFDVDGVLANFTKAAVKIANQNYGLRLDPNWEPYNFSWTPDLTQEQAEGVFSAAKNIKNFWLGLEPLEGARVVSEFIKDPRVVKGQVEIYFVTARFQPKGLSTMAQTRQWIEENIGWAPNTSIIVTDQGVKKPLIYDGAGISYSIEDHDKVVQKTYDYFHDHQHFHHNAFLLDQKWNRNAKHLDGLRVQSVEEYLDKIRREIL